MSSGFVRARLHRHPELEIAIQVRVGIELGGVGRQIAAYRRAEVVVDMLDADAERLARYVRDRLVGFSVGSEGRSAKTERVKADVAAMTRAGLEPATYGLKARA